jgi:uncharacterized protein (TIGR04255 family)
MRLPKELLINPLVSSTVELRFTSNIDKSKLLPMMLTEFYNEFPNLEESRIPFELKQKNEELKFFPDYTLKNDLYSIGFSNNVLALEIESNYTLWDNYFGFIKKILKRLFDLGFIDLISRIAVRYVSFFDNGKNINEILLHKPKLGLSDYDDDMNSFVTTVNKNNNIFYIQIFKETKLKKNNDDDDISSGSIIDIDASYTEEFKFDNFDHVCNIISDLHDDEKKLFFSMLKESFIDSLQPIYQ